MKYAVVDRGSRINSEINLGKCYVLPPGRYFMVASRIVGFPDKSGGLGAGCTFRLLQSQPAELIVGKGGKVKWKTHGVEMPPTPTPKIRALARNPAPTGGPAACLARLARAVDEGNASAARSLVYAKRGASQTLALVKMELSMRQLSKAVAARFGGEGAWQFFRAF